MVQIIRRIVTAVQAPVMAAIEAGYGPHVEDVAQTMKAAIAAGVAGVNIENNTANST